MARAWLPLSILLIGLTLHAERREPSIFLEYEREVSRFGDTNKMDDNPFKKMMAPIAVSKPAPPVPPVVKNVIMTEPSAKIDNPASIGNDSVPYLVVSKSLSKTICPDEKVSEPAQEPLVASNTMLNNLKTAKEKLLAKAKEFLGTPYGFGNKNATITDCSGFTQQVYSQFGVSLPHSAAEQAAFGEMVEADDLQIGDLLFYRTYKDEPSHVGIYAGEGKIIHASFKAHKVQLDSIDKGYYKQRFLYAKRLAFNDKQRLSDTQQK